MGAQIEQANLSEEAIAVRAYQKYVERGYEQGYDLDDWLAAEAELRAELASAPAAANPAQRATRARANQTTSVRS